MQQPQYLDDDNEPYTPTPIVPSASTSNLSHGSSQGSNSRRPSLTPITTTNTLTLINPEVPLPTPRGSFSGRPRGESGTLQPLQNRPGSSNGSNTPSSTSLSLPRTHTASLTPLSLGTPRANDPQASQPSSSSGPGPKFPTNTTTTTSSTEMPSTHQLPREPHSPRSSMSLKTKTLPFFKIVLVGEAEVGKTSMLRQLIEGEFSEQYIPTSGLDTITQSIKVPLDAITKVKRQQEQAGQDQSQPNQGGDYNEDDGRASGNGRISGGLGSPPSTSTSPQHSPHRTPPTTTIHLQLWDGGSRTIRPILPTILRDCMACLLVYDVGNRRSFDAVKYYLNLTKMHKPDALVLLIANKCDLYPAHGQPTVEPIPEGEELHEQEHDNDGDGHHPPRLPASPQHQKQYPHLDLVSSEEGQAFAAENNLPFIQISAKDGNNIRLLFSQLCAVLPMLLDDDDEEEEADGRQPIGEPKEIPESEERLPTCTDGYCSIM